MNKKSYFAYALTKRKDVYHPPLEQQLQFIFDRYERRFGEQPAAHFVGPLVDAQGYVLIKEGEVWIEIPDRTREFTTGYEKQ